MSETVNVAGKGTQKADEIQIGHRVQEQALLGERFAFEPTPIPYA